MDWQIFRNDKFAEANGFDKYAAQKKQAGVDELAGFVNIYEVQTLVKLLNKTDEEVYKMNDVYATKILLGNKKNINFENKFTEIRMKS